MFRLATADLETGILSVNVSALSKHKYGSTLHATLEAFVYGTPIDYLHLMSRMNDSRERALNVLYFSNLLHELRHFFDLLLTPYGAFLLRHFFQNAQIVSTLLGAGEPVIVPFVRASDSFYYKNVLNLTNFESTDAYKYATRFKRYRDIFSHDAAGIAHENGKIIRFGGKAMLEALAFSLQANFLHFPTLRSPALEEAFPGAYAPYDSTDPSTLDVIYRWFVPLQHTIGKSANSASAKLLHVAIFASLCGRYRSGKSTQHSHWLDSLPTFDVGSQLPSTLFRALLGELINRHEGKSIDADMTWDDAWEIVDSIFEHETGNRIVTAIDFDIEQDELLAASVKLAEQGRPNDDPLRRTFNWYRSVTTMRRRVFSKASMRPATFADSLGNLEFFGPELTAPIEFVYPASSNVIFPGSTSIDSDVLPLPSEMTKMIKLTPGRSILDRVRYLLMRRPVPSERVYYSSMRMRGEQEVPEREVLAWREMSSFVVPLIRTVLYSHDPHVIVGRKSSTVMEVVGSSPNVFFAGATNSVFEVEGVHHHFNFYDVQSAECDSCTDGRRYGRHDLCSVSSLTLRNNATFIKEIDSLEEGVHRHIKLRDWAEYLLCRDCFSRYFPEKEWQE
jgi:hypothetical protein